MNNINNENVFDASGIESKIQNLIISSPVNTIEEKVIVLTNIFKLVSPFKLDRYATEAIIRSAKLLGLRSDPKVFLDDYASYLNKQTNA